MSEEDSREEEVSKEEEEEEEEKSEEEVKEEENEEREKKGKKRGRPAGKTATAAKRQKKEKAAEGEGGEKKKRKKTVRKHPKTIEMVVEAIEILDDSHGTSVQGIKSYILDNFKTVRPDMIKSMLRHALTTGLKQNVVARPKGQADTQVMSGRYLLGKAARMEEEEILPSKNRSPLPPKPAKKGKKGKKGKKKGWSTSPGKGKGRPVKRGRK